jgi:hypothetical protein
VGQAAGRRREQNARQQPQQDKENAMMKTALALAMGALASAPVFAAEPASIDWSAIPVKKVRLFYPGQASYEWLQTPEHKKGDRAIAQGRSCTSCHEDDEAEVGNRISKGTSNEATPIAGKKGTLDLSVQAAHDDKFLYLRFQWATQNKAPGDAYPQLRFDGKEWKRYGAPRLGKEVLAGQMQAIYEDRLSIMVDDGKVPNFSKHGCWITCHDGMRDMRNEATKEQLAANPLLKGRADVRKYLPATREAKGSWDKTKSAEDIAKQKAAGEFVDLWQWRAHRSNPVGMADDGYVLEYRLFDAGKNMFVSNADAATKMPKMMFDATKTGQKALTTADIQKPGKAQVLVPGQTAVPFDANAGWKAGDMLPQYYVQREAASGSAADNAYARGAWKDGGWTMVMARPLGLANPDDKALKVGDVVNVGFAVHDDNVTTRGHHVSFPLRLGIGAKADITATTLK